MNASRSGRFWERRYARSQQVVSDLNSDPALAADLPSPALITAPEGARWQVSIVPPGESVTSRAWFGVLAYLGVLFSYGGWAPRSDNDLFVVVAARRRGSWRGFEQVLLEVFDDPSRAIERFRSMRAAIIKGGSPIMEKRGLG